MKTNILFRIPYLIIPFLELKFNIGILIISFLEEFIFRFLLIRKDVILTYDKYILSSFLYSIYKTVFFGALVRTYFLSNFFSGLFWCLLTKEYYMLELCIFRYFYIFYILK
jgi:membrane protease YdiL (CAAX protease family)